MKVTDLRSMLSEDEGRVPYVYRDSLDYETIGVGHLVDKRKGGCLPEHIIDALLDDDIEKHRADVFKTLPWARDLDEVRQAVLINMHFQLGDGLYNFKQTLKYVEAKNFEAASVEMLNSTWAQQTPERAERESRMMNTGRWESYYQ